ncbi:MAG: DUF2029 domain-containing protein [Acidobacteria bacterium]|nr:DUF2029 domain-containing protein [Acidobacteriota bacterium]
MEQPEKHWRWLDSLTPFVALAGLAASLAPDYLRVRTWEVPGTDFKTLFAAVRLFSQDNDPYSPHLLRNVFHSDGVIEPATWFSHMPVYPPFTLAVLRPLAVFNMATASWIWFLLSAVLMAFALGAMLRWSREELGMPLGWRMLLLAICVACPLVGYALEVGNVSTAVSALAMLAYFLNGKSILRGVLLALALLLKPHLAVWLVIAMLATPVRQVRASALWAACISALFAALSSAWLFMQGNLASIWQSYRAMLQAESAASMSAHSRELLPITAQITSIWSLAGYVSASPLAKLFAALLIVICAAALMWSVWRARYRENSVFHLMIAATWVSFGMIATYHRAHDAQLLLIVLPVLFTLLGKGRLTFAACDKLTESGTDLSDQGISMRGLQVCSIALLLLLGGTWFDLGGRDSLLAFRQTSLFSVVFTVLCSIFTVFMLKNAKKSRYRR